MQVGTIGELVIQDVYDRGVPNQERILIRPTQAVNMGQYGIMLGVKDSQTIESALPVNDCLFWFGDGIVEPQSWIFIYTGPGTGRKTEMQNKEPAYVLHWGRTHTVFANSLVVPILFRVDAVYLGRTPANLPQAALESWSK